MDLIISLSLVVYNNIFELEGPRSPTSISFSKAMPVFKTNPRGLIYFFVLVSIDENFFGPKNLGGSFEKNKPKPTDELMHYYRLVSPPPPPPPFAVLLFYTRHYMVLCVFIYIYINVRRSIVLDKRAPST